MSVTLYDNSIRDKLKEVFDNVVLSPPDLAFQRNAELPENEGKVKLPLLSLFRENYNINQEDFNAYRFRRGRKVEYNTTEMTSVKMMKSLPIRVDYILDAWATTREDVDKLVSEIVIWLVNEPTITITVPNIEENNNQNFNLSLGDITDNSDIMSFEQRGRFYRVSIPVFIPDAQLFSTEDLKTAINFSFDLISLDEI